MYRLLATDIDDTLLAPDGSLPEANRTALRAIHDAGIAIVFCSGRADASIRSIAAGILTLTDDMYLVSFNGARVVTADTRRVVTKHHVPAESTERISDYARRNGLYLQGYIDDDFLAERKTDITEAYARATGANYRIVENLAQLLPEGSPKLLFIGDNRQLARHAEIMRRADAAIDLMFSKPTYLEIVAAGVSKGEALERLATKLGLSLDEIVAVGDAPNDVSMLQSAGVGVAVANAKPEAKTAADLVLESSAAEGSMVEVARRLFGLRL